jgi:hypothetical protein
MVVVHYTDLFSVEDMIFASRINQIKIINHMLISEILIFMNLINLMIKIHGKNFQVESKIISLRLNNIKFIN